MIASGTLTLGVCGHHVSGHWEEGSCQVCLPFVVGVAVTQDWRVLARYTGANSMLAVHAGLSFKWCPPLGAARVAQEDRYRQHALVHSCEELYILGGANGLQHTAQCQSVRFVGCRGQAEAQPVSESSGMQGVEKDVCGHAGRHCLLCASHMSRLHTAPC